MEVCVHWDMLILSDGPTAERLFSKTKDIAFFLFTNLIVAFLYLEIAIQNICSSF